jgi:hypothetical protein
MEIGNRMTNKTDKIDPAFPRPAVYTQSHGLASPEQDGMSLRDYFASKAMQGLTANVGDWPIVEAIAKNAYAIADAMMKEREQ